MENKFLGIVCIATNNENGHWVDYHYNLRKVLYSNVRDMENEFREIIFRARSEETGEWVEGNYHHNTRKGSFHAIVPKETNEMVYVYRESLQIKDINGEWVSI